MRGFSLIDVCLVVVFVLSWSAIGIGLEDIAGSKGIVERLFRGRFALLCIVVHYRRRGHDGTGRIDSVGAVQSARDQLRLERRSVPCPPSS